MFINILHNNYIAKLFTENLESQKEQFEASVINQNYKHILLSTIDNLWKQHLHTIDHLKDSIHLRSYGQKDPVLEYQRESLELFSEMMNEFKKEVTKLASHTDFAQNTENDFDPQMDMDGMIEKIIARTAPRPNCPKKAHRPKKKTLIPKVKKSFVLLIYFVNIKIWIVHKTKIFNSIRLMFFFFIQICEIEIIFPITIFSI